MADGNVIKLPVTEERAPAKKKARPPKFNARQEAQTRQKNVRRLAALGEEDGSVKLLEELVFGAEDELVERLVEEDEQQVDTLLLEDAAEESGQSEAEDEARQQRQPTRVAAWVDEDDELEEAVYMKHRYRRDLIKGEAESIMTKQKLQQRMREQRTGNFVASPDSLPSGVLRKCLPANSARPSDDRLTTVQFHPSAQVVMTAGLDQSVSLFQVDGKTNPKIQSIHLDRFPVHKAQFSHDGETVIATSLKNKMFYLYDMMEGRVTPVHTVRGLNEARVKEFSVCPEGGALLLTGTNGYLHLLTLKTKEVVRSMKINGDISGVAFSHDGSKVYANSEEGEVYVWDMRSSRCVNRFTDDGCVKGTSIAASPNGRYLACGSQAGVVNIYSQEACLNSANPKPLRAVMNLLTSATSLAFNPSSEILAIASRAEDEAIRLVHLSSLSVFSNFPVSKKKMVYRASCLDFSPHSGFFSLANNKGHAPLFRLLHYKDF
uniref:U3 small nucleolar RNA-associated protein 18 homolog n=1 Tax=Sparus aurata TaxID=8175 RepID=A0A671W2L4_SPAAU